MTLAVCQFIENFLFCLHVVYQTCDPPAAQINIHGNTSGLDILALDSPHDIDYNVSSCNSRHLHSSMYSKGEDMEPASAWDLHRHSCRYCCFWGLQHYPRCAHSPTPDICNISPQNSAEAQAGHLRRLHHWSPVSTSFKPQDYHAPRD